MNKKTFLPILFVLLMACSCNKKTSTPSSSLSSSSSSSNNENILQVIESLNDFKTKLLNLDQQVSKINYDTSQINNYYGLDLESQEVGITSIYNDHFAQTSFEQTIGESKYNGQREYGIFNNQLYQISYFGENDSSNSLKNYENNESNLNSLFAFSFVQEYIHTIINGTLEYYTRALSEKIRLTLTTNYDLLDFSSDGVYILSFRFEYHDSTGKTKVEEVQRDDQIVISNAAITSAQTTMLYSLMDDVNYLYQESTHTYEYEALTTYSGDKLISKFIS